MKDDHIMRKIICTIGAAVLLASCGQKEDGASETGNVVAPLNPAFTTKPTAEPTRFPLPAEQPTGMVNAKAPPEVAAHIARQERCAHWREEQAGGATRPEVAEGMARECKGIDQQLTDLRRQNDRDGTIMAMLRPFTPVE